MLTNQNPAFAVDFEDSFGQVTTPPVSTPAGVLPSRIQPERTNWGLRELSRAALRKGDFATARQHVLQLCRDAERRADLIGQARSFCDLAFIYVVAGQMTNAEKAYARSYNIWRVLRPSLNSPGMDEYIHFLWDYSIFLRSQGNISHATRLEKQLDQLNQNLTACQRNFHRAERLAERGQYAVAQQLYEDALIESCLTRDIAMQLRIADRLACFYQMIGKVDLAAQLRERKAQLEQARRASRFQTPAGQVNVAAG